MAFAQMTMGTPRQAASRPIVPLMVMTAFARSSTVSVLRSAGARRTFSHSTSRKYFSPMPASP
jgi:hypothetical protein